MRYFLYFPFFSWILLTMGQLTPTLTKAMNVVCGGVSRPAVHRNPDSPCFSLSLSLLLSLSYTHTHTHTQAIDAGGVAREWFTCVINSLFNVNFGLFKYGQDQLCFQINEFSGLLCLRGRGYTHTHSTILHAECIYIPISISRPDFCAASGINRMFCTQSTT